MEASISSAVASSPFAQLGVEGIILKYVSCRRQTFVGTFIRHLSNVTGLYQGGGGAFGTNGGLSSAGDVLQDDAFDP